MEEYHPKIDPGDGTRPLHESVRWDIDSITSTITPRVLALADDTELVESLVKLEAADSAWVNSLIVNDLVSDRSATVNGAIGFLDAVIAVYGRLVEGQHH